MKKSVLLLANIHEGRLQARFQVLDVPLEDSPHFPFLFLTLHIEIIQHPVAQKRHPTLESLGIDNDFLVFLLIVFRTEKGKNAFANGPVLGPFLSRLAQLAFVDQYGRGFLGSLAQLLLDGNVGDVRLGAL